uniref:ATP synthase complex subunit 8 n=1 Tax=Tetrataenia surinama TaxID=2480051 RepID=A0A3G2LJS5_9ORTH|nr:ATP synthase F0 subunit 8 [Tetrataenia surinama]
MPQMYPLMWFSLFILFIIVMILFNQMNFFSFKMNPNKWEEKIKNKDLTWKW